MAVYTLFSQSGSGTLQADATAYTFGVQFTVSVSGATLTGIWFYSAASAAALPTTIALYAVSGASLVHSETPSWSAAAGTGWVRSAFSAPPSLTASTSYKACAFFSPAGQNWYSDTANYWSSGAGSGGITSGPLSAPANGGGDGGQDTFTQSGSLAYPSSSFNASNYWVDPEVTTAAPAAPAAQVAAFMSSM
jgi:3D (Asp-Asp-Asp) domain-containing protein